jgi:hypothetical protein
VNLQPGPAAAPGCESWRNVRDHRASVRSGHADPAAVDAARAAVGQRGHRTESRWLASMTEWYSRAPQVNSVLVATISATTRSSGRAGSVESSSTERRYLSDSSFRRSMQGRNLLGSGLATPVLTPMSRHAVQRPTLGERSLLPIFDSFDRRRWRISRRKVVLVSLAAANRPELAYTPNRRPVNVSAEVQLHRRPSNCAAMAHRVRAYV